MMNADTVETILQTAALVAPALDPKAAAALGVLVPVATQLIHAATALHQAGVLPPAQLAELFTTIGADIERTHEAWAALDTKGA